MVSPVPRTARVRTPGRSQPPVATTSPVCAEILPVPENAGRCHVYRLMQRQGLPWRLALVTFSVRGVLNFLAAVTSPLRTASPCGRSTVRSAKLTWP